jgi:hypothetical protein
MVSGAINYYELAIEKDRDSIFTAIWKRGIVICIQIPTILYLETRARILSRQLP